MKVLIITGGNSSERKISLISAKAVKEALTANGYKVHSFDLRQGFTKLKSLITKFDLIFPVLHGEEGEGGSLQQFLSKQQKPFVGGSPEGFKTGWYKLSFKKFCKKNNILTSRWKRVKVLSDIANFGFPCVLKSSVGGSSKEVIIIRDKQILNSQSVQRLLLAHQDLFVEEFLPGIEVTVGILHNQALPVLEIIPPADGWFDYTNKYSGQTQEIPFAPSVDQDMQERVQQIATYIHSNLQLGSFSRIDFIISQNQPFVLEVNTIPGLTHESLLPNAAKAAGYSYSDLIIKLVTG